MNDTTRAVATTDDKPKLLPVSDDGEFSALLDSNRFAQIQRVAKLFSESDLVPEVFQGKPANCAVALQMAFRMRVDPMMLMQNMYIVYGRPGIEAKLAIALMNQRGPFEGPVQWRAEGEGETRSWTAYATHKGTGERCEATVTWKMVKAEGWLDKKGSKWQTIPDLMGRYRSAMFLGRLYCPEVLLGLPTDDELRDVSGMHTIVGERVDSGVIELPRAKSAPPQGERVIDADPGDTKPDVDEAQATSGETTTGNGETASLDIEPKAKSGAATAAADPMSKKASEAQKRMIIDIAKRQGITVAVLDEHLIDRFTMGIDELPMGLVNEAIQFARLIKPAAA